MSTDIAVPVPSRRGLRLAAGISCAIAVLVVGIGITTRLQSEARLRQVTYSLAPPVVTLVQPQQADGSYSIDLPGRLEAYTRAPIYSRVSGYLKDWKVDIGTPVRAGQLLADIEAPDLDQQLAQAQANLKTARANANLATTTATRWQLLLKTHSVAQQDADVRNGDRDAKDAIVKATEAEVHQLEVMESFKRLLAPFDGVVTARLTDIGDLVDAGSGLAGTTQGRQLFTISYTEKLRLYVNVPQNNAPQVKPGIKAQLTVPEHPGQTYNAVVESSAQAIDPASGATLVQLSVDNPRAELAPGAYANVHFDVPGTTTTVRVPASAVIVDHSGVHVAALGPDNRVVLKAVTIGRDLGSEIEISSGLTVSDQVIDSPPDGVAAGDSVRLARAS